MLERSPSHAARQRRYRRRQRDGLMIVPAAISDAVWTCSFAYLAELREVSVYVLVVLARGRERWRNRSVIFMIFTAYFDESGTHAGAELTAMAGFLGDVRQWQKFEKRA